MHDLADILSLPQRLTSEHHLLFYRQVSGSLRLLDDSSRRGLERQCSFFEAYTHTDRPEKSILEIKTLSSLST